MNVRLLSGIFKLAIALLSVMRVADCDLPLLVPG